MIEIEDEEIEEMMDHDWSIKKKIEWIIFNQSSGRRKFNVPETVDEILEVFKDHSEKGDK
jgi:hypothetical protein